jgi:hypothetical protein
MKEKWIVEMIIDTEDKDLYFPAEWKLLNREKVIEEC